MHLHDDKWNEKVEDFTSDDILEDPNNPLSTSIGLQIIYPHFNHTEGVVESPKRATLLWGGQATEQDKMDKTRQRFDFGECGYWLIMQNFS